MAKQEKHFTPIPHEMLEKLARMHLAPNQWQLLMCILRKTNGWHKDQDWIALSQFTKMTGIKKPNVSRGLVALRKRRVIEMGPRSIRLLPRHLWLTDHRLAGHLGAATVT